MIETRANDPKWQLLARVLTGMLELFGDQWQNAGNIFDAARASRERAPALLDAIEEITERARDDKGAKVTLGKWLDGEKGRVVNSLRLEKTRDEHAKADLWKTARCA